jgi:hypothetical protein
MMVAAVRALNWSAMKTRSPRWTADERAFLARRGQRSERNMIE